MYKPILFVAVVLFVQNLQAQVFITPKLLGKLPEKLTESSGLIIQSPDTLWSHNDSGNSAKVYAFDSTGQEITDRKFSKISKEDWEEISKDEHGYVYIGDIGNNDNARKNLLILRFTSGFFDENEELKVDSIQFQYEDQTLFPPPSSSLNFDCEAFVVMNDTVFLFTKDRTKPYISQTLLYKFPAKPGMQTARYAGSFKTDVSLFLQGSITGAALSPDKKKLALTGYLRMWLFTDFEGSNFFDGKVTTFQYTEYTQKESVAFVDECNVYITDEFNSQLNTGGNLYTINLCSTVASSDHSPQQNPLIYYNQYTEKLNIENLKGPAEVIVFNQNGFRIFGAGVFGNQEITQISTGGKLMPGMYICLVKTPGGFFSGKFIVCH